MQPAQISFPRRHHPPFPRFARADAAFTKRNNRHDFEDMAAHLARQNVCTQLMICVGTLVQIPGKVKETITLLIDTSPGQALRNPIPSSSTRTSGDIRRSGHARDRGRGQVAKKHRDDRVSGIRGNSLLYIHRLCCILRLAKKRFVVRTAPDTGWTKDTGRNRGIPRRALHQEWGGTSMWLMTKYGFFSIVRKAPGTFHVRSREIRDIENLVRHVPLPGARILDTTGRDYSARIIVGPEEVRAILNFLGENIDYDHFQEMIGNTPDQSHKPYQRIGNVLTCSLGAYGRKGSRTPP